MVQSRHACGRVRPQGGRVRVSSHSHRPALLVSAGLREVPPGASLSGGLA